MHIALIGSQASIHIIRWANSLSDSGIKVHVFTMHDPTDLFNSKVKVVKLPFRNPHGYFLNMPYLRKELNKIKPDLIHSFYALGHGFLGRMTGYKPHIISVLGSDIYDDISNPIFRRITIKNLEKASLICSTSKVMANKINEYVDRPIQITPFGIDTKLFSVRNRTENKEAGGFTIGTVKWLEDKYGVDTLISSFAKFRKKYPQENIKLVIVGEGSKKNELESLAHRLGVDQDCTFIGRVFHHEVNIWLKQFDVYVALSRLDSESFGVAVLEASSMKIPVLVSDAGGLPEVVVDSETGIIIPKENISKAAEVLEMLYLNKELRKELGKAGRERVLNNYNWDESVNKMIQVYREVLKEY